MNFNDLALDLAAVVNVISNNIGIALSCTVATAKRIDEKLAILVECLAESGCDTDDQ